MLHTVVKAWQPLVLKGLSLNLWHRSGRNLSTNFLSGYFHWDDPIFIDLFFTSFHRVGFTFPLSLNWWRSQCRTALIIRAAASVSSPGIPTAAGMGSSAPKSGRQTSRHLVCSCSNSLVWKWNHNDIFKMQFSYRLCSSVPGSRMSMELTHQPFAAEQRWAHGLQNLHPQVSELNSSVLSNIFFRPWLLWLQRESFETFFISLVSLCQVEEQCVCCSETKFCVYVIQRWSLSIQQKCTRGKYIWKLLWQVKK